MTGRSTLARTDILRCMHKLFVALALALTACVTEPAEITAESTEALCPTIAQYYCGPVEFSGPVGFSGSGASVSRRVTTLPPASLSILPESFDVIRVPPLVSSKTWTVLTPADHRRITVVIERACQGNEQAELYVNDGAKNLAKFPTCVFQRGEVTLMYDGAMWFPSGWSGTATVN